jgi:tight adherence protein C
MAAVLGFVAAGAVLIALQGWILVRTGDVIPRLELPSLAMVPKRRRSLVGSFFDAMGERLGPRALAVMGVKRIQAIRRRLGAAGRPGGITVEQFVGRKASFAVLFSFVGVIFGLFRGQLWALVVLPVLGWFWMDGWLWLVERHRQGQIERNLPDFLDIVAVTVGAGLGFRAALARVAEAQGGPISQEIMTALHQMDLGVTRRLALEELRARNPSQTLSQFVTALLQAEELGAPLSGTLVELAANMRREAAQEARRRAARAAPRISLVVTLLIVPGSLILMVVGLFLGTNVHLGRFVGNG